MARQTAKIRPPPPPAPTPYRDDYYTWALEQMDLLRAGRLTEIDAESLADELLALANNQINRLEGALTILLLHLLKWDYLPGRRSRSWAISVRTQRRHVSRLLNKNRGLRSALNEAIKEGYADGRDRALKETRLAETDLPEACPYTFEEMMERPIEYDPDATSS